MKEILNEPGIVVLGVFTLLVIVAYALSLLKSKP